MVKEITVKNKRTEQEIVFDKEGTNGLVIDKMDWDVPSISNESYRIPFQIGETLSSVIVGTRKPKLIAYVVSTQDFRDADWDSYYKQQEQEIVSIKKELNSFFNIYDDYEIATDNYYLNCRLNEPIKYSTDEKENNEVLCLFSAEFTCYNPMFLEIGGSEAEFRHIDERFRFPLTIPKNEGIIIGIEDNVTTKTIENKGDVKIGFVVVMKVLNGVVKYPELRNLTTDERIKIYDSIIVSSFKKDDYIVINTKNGEEDIYYYDSETGETKELIGEITSDSSFFQLQKGENILTYSVDSSSTGQLDCIIYYDNEYFNIEVM